jgi:probable rRNA maturation factor
MTGHLTVSNRQKAVPVDVSAYERDYELLRQALFANLSRNTPPHLKKRVLSALEKRGLFSIAFVSNQRIKTLNRDWMGKNKPTDVLSFPLELDPPPAGVPWEVGEIVISLERAQEQASEYGHSFEREMAFLFVHGMLHVLGFDHMEPDEEKEMFGRQKQILAAAGFRRK